MGYTTVVGFQEPYVIKISNTGIVDLENVKLFDAFRDINNPYFGNGQDLVNGHLKIQTLPSNPLIYEKHELMGYRDLLGSLVKPINIGVIYIQNDQCPDDWGSFIIKSSHGEPIDFHPELHKSQKSKNIVCCAVEFLLDLYSVMTISKIPAQSEVTFYFYPF